MRATPSPRGVRRLLLAAMLATTAVPALVTAPAAAHEPVSYAELVAQAKPAVVTVKAKIEPRIKAADMAANPRFGDLPDDLKEGPMGDMLRRFFEQGPGDGRGPATPSHGLGSGFVIGADGVIVTNHHVIDGASEVTVTLADGADHVAEIVGVDEKTDLAVLRIDAGEELATVAWADSDAVRVGDPAIAIGNPFGLGGTVTAGIVSARERDINAGPYDDFLQVDTAINRGNSGGPVFDDEGQVIGVSTMIFSPTGGNVGLGFAIPANQAKRIVATILEHGHVERGRIGVAIQPVTDDLAKALGLEEARGALVSSVEDGSPAALAELAAGDVILGFGDAEIDDVKALVHAVAAVAPGSERSITVWRDGGEIAAQITVGETPKPEKQAAAATPAASEATSVARLGAALKLGETGVTVAEIEADAAASKAGLRPGDVIVSIDRKPVESVAEAVTALEGGARETALLLVAREGRRRFIAVPLSA